MTTADLLFFAFFPSEPELVSPSRSRHGLPDDFDLGLYQVGQVHRDAHPEAFEGLLSGPLLERAAARGVDVAALQACQCRLHLRCTQPPTEDRGYLRGAWGLVRAMLEAGAVAVLDAHTHRWWSEQALARVPVDEPFDVRREIVVVHEMDADDAEQGFVRHTRGMLKLGLPDLVMFARDPADERPAALLNALAAHLAQGATLRPGDTVSAGGETWRASAYEAGRGVPDLHLNNEGLLLTRAAP